jgi:hypothetical protein
VRHIGLEARCNLLERLVIVAEEGIGRHLAMLGDIALDQGLLSKARPVEHDQFGVGGKRSSKMPGGPTPAGRSWTG